MLEQMEKNDSTDLKDKVRTLEVQNAQLIQLLRSQGCRVDSLINSETSPNVIQPVNVVPLESFPTFLPSTSSSSNVETTNLLDNKHPRPIRPKPSLQFVNSLTLNETKNVLTPSSLINNNASTSRDDFSTQNKTKTPKIRPRIRKPPTIPIPIAPNLGRPLAPAPLNVQRIVTTTKRSPKKRTSKSADRFAESISGLMKNFDQELIASNFLSTNRNESTTVSVPMTTLISDDDLRLVEMNFDETNFLKQIESEENFYPKSIESRRTSSSTDPSLPLHSTYPGSSLINNNVFTTIVPLTIRTSTRSLPEENVRLTARHIEPSQVATFESAKYSDLLDELGIVTDQDVLTHAQTTNNDLPLNFVDFDNFSSPKSDVVESTITDLSSIIQIEQNQTSVVHRIVFEPILSPSDEKRRKTSSNCDQNECSTHDDFDDQMTQTTFITPPPDNETHDDFSQSIKLNQFDCSTNKSQYFIPMPSSNVSSTSTQFDPFAQNYSYGIHPPFVAPVSTNFYPNFHQTCYNSNFMSSHDHHSYNR